MRVLITGAGGFVGGHLIRYLQATMDEVTLHGTTLPGSESSSDLPVTFHALDLRDSQAVQDVIAEVQPDHVYHLAAQAFVPRSFDDPWETLENNIRSQLNLIQAYLDVGIAPRTLIVSSAEIYGPVTEDELPITEQASLRPTSPYSVSKIAQDMLAKQYHLSHDLPLMRARPFNHFGPGQSKHFVAPSFALQIASIEAGVQEPVIYVGDLSARRDFTDVRDIVRAYHLIVERGIPGEAYNVASGQAHSVHDLLQGLLAHTEHEISVEVDSARLRPTSIPVLRGSVAHLHRVTGWRPEVSFEQSLKDILDDCRGRIE